MKIYEKDYHCFGCGENGDIFSFMQKFYGVGFKEAFQMLGGTYEKEPSYSLKLAIYRAKKEQEMKRKAARRMKKMRRLNNDLINIYRRYVQKSEPLSDVWCDCYNALQYQLYVMECLERTGYEELN